MRRLRRIALAAVLCCACLPLPGCGLFQPPQGTTAEAQQVVTIDKATALVKSFRVGVDTVNGLVKAGLVPKSAYPVILKSINAGWSVIQDIDAAIGDGSKPIPALTFADLSSRLAPYLFDVVKAQADAVTGKVAKASAKPSPKPVAPPVPDIAVPATVDDAPTPP